MKMSLRKMLAKILSNERTLNSSAIKSETTGTGGKIAYIRLHKDSAGYYIAIWEEDKTARTGYIRLS